MRLWDLILTGVAEIRTHKLRSFLSFFAISIGIATFFYTLSMLSQRYRDIDRATAVSGEGRLDVELEEIPPFSLKQYDELKSILPEESSISVATWSWWADLTYNNIYLYNNHVFGTTPEWKDSRNIFQLEGRFITWNDVLNHTRVAVIVVHPRDRRERRGHSWTSNRENYTKQEALDDFTSHRNLLHQTVLIENETFTVVGLLHMPTYEQDPRFDSDKRDEHNMPAVLVPLTSLYDIAPSWRETHDTSLRVLTNKKGTTRTASAKLDSFLRLQYGTEKSHKIEAFDDMIQAELRQARRELNKMFFMGLIAMIAGGIGIMNVTMAVILSRTREIGVRRALGATRKDILFQFLVEAMLLGLCGAVAGMVLGYLAVLHLAGSASQMTFAWWVVVLSVLIALVTSFAFALYPAWQAARLKPVDALKHE